MSIGRRIKLDFYEYFCMCKLTQVHTHTQTHVQKSIFNWKKNFNIRPKILKVKEENIGTAL